MNLTQQRELSRRQGGAFYYTPAELRAQISVTEKRLDELRRALWQAEMSAQVQGALKK